MLPGSIMSVTAGFLWGTALGMVLNVTLASVAGIAPFYLGRFVARDWVQERVITPERVTSWGPALSG